METPIEVLRVEQSGISKELARFRACDTETRSLYCREWAQFVYKKHFVWNAKTQEEVPEGQQLNAHGGLQAGPYQINFIHDDATREEDVYKKERSALMIKKFMSLVESWTTTPARADEDSLITQIVQACQLWTTLPSGYSGLPDLFEPVEFNPYPDAIPLVEDPKDPSQLLDPLIIERQALCLPSDCFHLLKNLTGDILLSHTTPTCNHSKPTAKTPSDLEVDRAIFNEHEAVAVKKALAELKIALEQAWHPLNVFLDQLTEFDKRRSRLMGKDCQETIDTFFTSQKFVSFVDVWPVQLPNFKNKKSTPEEIAKVDSLFEQHLENMKSLVKEFMEEFAVAHLKEIHVLTTDLWKMIVPTIYEMGERMAAHEDHRGNKNANASKIGESLKALDIESLKKMESTKEVDAAQNRIVNSLTAKTTEYMNDIDNLLKLYREGRNTLSGRLEKLNNKDFKKKIKKVESGYYSIRQTFRYEVTENIFPEALFCKFSLVCLEPLMQEGEVMEAVTIEKEVKRFVESHKDLLQQKCALLENFEQGVQTGRRELAGVLGKLFLKEGMRIQGDNLALKRQQSLLKSMGVATDEQQKKKTKNKKKSSATSSGASTPALVEEPVKKAVAKDKKTAVSIEKKTPDIEKKAVAAASDKKTDTVDKKAAISGNQSASAEKKSVPEEKKPAPEEKKSVPEEKKPAPEEKKPAPEEKKPSSEEKKPSSEEKKPVVEEKKPAASAKKKTAPEEKKPVVEKRPVIVEKKTEEKKEPASMVEKKTTSPVKQTAVPNAHVKEPSATADQFNDIQDWDTIRASVLTAESNKKTLEPEVHDWDTLRAQVMLSSEKKPTTNASTPVGWSTVAAAGATATTDVESKTKKIDSTTPPDLDHWPAPVSKSPKETTSSSLSSAQWPKAVPPNDTASQGWGKAASIASNKDIQKDISLGGWGSSKISSPSASSTNAGWSTATNSTDKWNTNADKTPWTSPSLAKKKQHSKWTTDEDSNVSLGGWGSPTSSFNGASGGSGGSSSDSNWRSSSNKKTEITTALPLPNASWDNAKLPWDTVEPTTASNKSSSSATPIKENVKKPVVQHVVTPNASTADAAGLMNIASPLNVSQPPGMAMPPGTSVIAANNSSSNNCSAPPGIQSSKLMPPGLSAPTAAAIPNASAFIGLSATTPIPTLSAPIQSNSHQLQEPLPHDLDEMSSDMLLMIIKNLHRENGSLIQSVYNMQQEMAMMTSRYAEIIALARERETQTLALFESRKQTEMEEARRYVLSLEARVKKLEERGSPVKSTAMATTANTANNNNTTTTTSTAGFGNQDLFAGYREEMAPTQQRHHNHRSNHGKKLWQKNTVVRCGNCGEVGHASQECKGYCRYCGSCEHLSEACPLN